MRSFKRRLAVATTMTVALVACYGHVPAGDGSAADGGPLASGPFVLTSLGTRLAPLANGVGITYDGEELWLLALSMGDYTLIRFDAASWTVDRKFVLDGLSDSNAYGITCDGSKIWVSVAGDTNALVTVDPNTGALGEQMSSPTQLGPSELDFDGTNLWLSSGTGDLYEISTGGVLLEHYPISPDATGRDSGVACRSGELFADMEVYSATSGAALGAATHNGGSAFQRTELGPSVFVGGNLMILSSLGITTYSVSPR